MKKIAKKNAITAYKVFNPDWSCKSYKFEVGKSYEHAGRVQICHSGFHACLTIEHCFSYYPFDYQNKVAEVQIWGSVDESDEDSKVCGSHINIIREIPWPEVQVLANHGRDNTGHSNTGDRNTGDRNTGYRNTADRNTGNWNTGDSNTGDSNTGYRNTGAFCTNLNPEVFLFDKPSGILVRDWEKHPAFRVMTSLEIAFWIPSWSMTDEEKAAHPSWKTADGYLKNITLHEAWANLWPNLTKENRAIFFALPNFDIEKWKEITGLDVTAEFEEWSQAK